MEKEDIAYCGLNCDVCKNRFTGIRENLLLRTRGNRPFGVRGGSRKNNLTFFAQALIDLKK